MRLKRILALCMAALMCAPCAGAELKKGDRGGSVLRVQDELYARGYLAEEGDGQYGQKTEDAVKLYQQEHQLDPTGIVDDATYDLLMNGDDVKVRKAQQRLSQLGYYSGAAGGEMDEATVQALRAFQQAHNIEVTGALDEETQTMLDSDSAMSDIALAQAQLIRLGYLQGTADGRFGEMSKAALILFQTANGLEPTGELDEASKAALFSAEAVGDEIRMQQQRLIELGYLGGTADGVFGAKSVAALKKFQQRHGLEATGELDAETLEILFSEDAKAVYPTLNSASVNVDAVKRLQQRLIDLGYLDGRADGDFGAKTLEAVKAFQQRLAEQRHEIEITGEATSEMQTYLFDSDYSTYFADVVSGSEGMDALRIERRLAALGYMDAAADRSFDDYAVNCLRAFQTDAELEVTGTADRATMDALFDGEAASAAQYVLHDVRMGETSAVAQYAQDALIRMGFYDQYSSMTGSVYDDLTEAALERLYTYLCGYNRSYAEAFSEIGVLSAAAVRMLMDAQLVVFAADINESSAADEISRVQRRLRGLFYDVEVDGSYGEKTVAAVTEFQTANGLNATGIADRETQRVLFSESAVGVWTEYMLKVSIDDQRVYVYALDESRQYQLIDTFICSSGLDTGPDDSTPRGIFTDTTEPLDRWHYFIEYECWAQYAWRIQGPIYFHSVIYSEKDESTLRMSSVYNLGRKASHGCIRLSVENAKWIYTHCDAGTIVIIY